MSEPASSSDEVQVLRHENAVLRAQLAWFKKRMFGGGKGEQLDAAQLKLNGVDEVREAVTERTEIIRYERTKQKKEPRVTPAETFAHLPVTETLEIVPESVLRWTPKIGQRGSLSPTSNPNDPNVQETTSA